MDRFPPQGGVSKGEFNNKIKYALSTHYLDAVQKNIY